MRLMGVWLMPNKLLEPPLELQWKLLMMPGTLWGDDNTTENLQTYMFFFLHLGGFL